MLLSHEFFLMFFLFRKKNWKIALLTKNKFAFPFLAFIRKSCNFTNYRPSLSMVCIPYVYKYRDLSDILFFRFKSVQFHECEIESSDVYLSMFLNRPKRQSFILHLSLSKNGQGSVKIRPCWLYAIVGNEVTEVQVESSAWFFRLVCWYSKDK